METAYACQGSQLRLSCPAGSVIRVMRANYGRFSVAICNEEGRTDWSVNCMAPRSLRVLQDRSARDKTNIVFINLKFIWSFCILLSCYRPKLKHL